MHKRKERIIMAGALEGIRVLDMGRVISAPMCSMILADMGAEVIKVEQPDCGDDCRTWSPVKTARVLTSLTSTGAKRVLP